MLETEEIVLRPLEDSDLDFLQEIENNKENWEFGSEKKKYSKQELVEYIVNAKIDITIAKQYRFVIEVQRNAIGFIDLFDYTADSAGVGVIISRGYRNRGLAKKALRSLIDYTFTTLNLSKLHCVIKKDNLASIKLFTSCNFELESEKEELQYFVKLAKK